MNSRSQDLRYPVGIQSFAKLREGGYVYVDKTAYVHRLIREGSYYFLSRPRRFGKSLLLSTIEAYYSGRRDLFKGLALDSLTDRWEPHPILHLDLNAGLYDSVEALDSKIDYELSRWETSFDISKTTAASSQRFGHIIEQVHLSTGKKVVILIDEYDKPMLSAIDNEPLADRFRNTLKAFYSNLKTMDQHIEFAMLTGVARFSKTSIFSDLNNLRDISFSPNYSGICGITGDEIDRYFTDGVQSLALKAGITVKAAREKLKNRYDGYHFSEDMLDIYNPFSLMNVFADERFGDYWFSSGTPTYVVKLLKARNWKLRDIEHYSINAAKLGEEGILSKEAIPTLYQSGYLTIKKYNREFNEYTLGYPNAEVEQSFINFLSPIFLGEDGSDSEFSIKHFVRDVKDGKVQSFMTRLDSLLRGVPHIGSSEPHEVYFQNAIYLTFKMIGFYSRVEEHTSDGRIDLTVETDKYVYLFEFKVDKSAAEAMNQIRAKEYWKKFEASGKQIYLIGANFSRSKRALDDILITTP
ncbi:MAG: ATP-binding protein [Lachnoclostridium sp.]|nr:ATP-binding protein [Lachnoclostridium sp.]